jgi:hypothetical protein
MTLKVERNKWWTRVAGDLAHIVGNDYPNLGQDKDDPDAVTYERQLFNLATDRVYALIAFSIIWGVDPTYDTFGQDIISHGGLIQFDRTQLKQYPHGYGLPSEEPIDAQAASCRSSGTARPVSPCPAC